MPQTVEEQLAIAEEKLTALAGMHNHLEERVEALEAVVAHLQAYLPQDKQEKAVEGQKMTDSEAIASIMGAATAASKGLPDGMVSN